LIADPTLKQFYADLNREEASFASTIESDNLGIYLRLALTELDLYDYNLRITQESTFEIHEQYLILSLGVCRLVQISLDSRPSFDIPFVNVVRDPDRTAEVLKIVAALGMTEHGRRVAQTVSSGHGTIRRTESGSYEISVPECLSDDGYYERAVAEHYRREHQRLATEALQSPQGEQLCKEVESLLEELVFPFGPFIGYGGHPLLDLFFFESALNDLPNLEGYDSFPGAAIFGGVTFQAYILALGFCIAIATRHERFAEALVKKDPSVKLENTLTITARTSSFVENLCDAVNQMGRERGLSEISIEDARQIFGVLSLGRENTALLARPGCSIPLMVRTSDDAFIKCLAGHRANPMQFLLDSLRHRFPEDYDRNQQSREKSMQAAITRHLNGCLDALEYRENVKVRINGKIRTDIDLVILDKQSGCILLMQLKSQDSYGHDLHAKQVRTSRLKEQVSDWLKTLQEWTDTAELAEVRSSLRLPKEFPPPRIHKVVISKHYASALNEIAAATDTICATWLQLFNALVIVERRPAQDRSLENLLRVLGDAACPGGPKSYFNGPDTDWILNDLVYAVRTVSTDNF
jgi:hypothetical protein